jgi:hypothetical protein
MVYVFPKLSKRNFLLFRVAGPGLGNLLFPWARARVCAKTNMLQVIDPTWLQFKPGPYIRREKDKRGYYDLFMPAQNSVTGINKIIKLLSIKWIDEASFHKDKDFYLNSKKHFIVTFEGLGNYFNDILYHHSILKDELYAISKHKHKTELNFDFSRTISVHLRLSDFKIGHQNTSLQFFKNIITQLRNELGNYKVYIFSDGNENEISDLLQLGNIDLLRFGSSLSDLLALSNSNILIASKNSTFSWWASYLGRSPVIWPADTTTTKIYYDCPDKEIFLNIDDKIPDSFFRKIN